MAQNKIRHQTICNIFATSLYPKLKIRYPQPLNVIIFLVLPLAPSCQKFLNISFLNSINRFCILITINTVLRKVLVVIIIFAVRNIVDSFVSKGSTVNLCAIGIAKAFDKVNHYALYMKLMKRRITVVLLNVIINLFSGCVSQTRFGLWPPQHLSHVRLVLVSGRAAGRVRSTQKTGNHHIRLFYFLQWARRMGPGD